MRNLRLGLVVLLVMGLLPVLARGQANATGTVNGQVMDQSGAVIVGAQVTLTDQATGEFQGQLSNSAGRFVFSNVKPGTFNVTVTMKGFQKLVVPSQKVTVGAAINLNLTMTVGATTQTVEVTAAPGAELQTLNSTMGESMSGASILSLPSLNRDVTAVLNTVPTAAPNFGGENDISAGGVAGRTSDQNTYTLDGGIITDDLAGDAGYVNDFAGTARGAIPTPIESIQEFKVNTNNTTADFGTSSGAQVLMTTKRGTNQFHGSAYDYLQNSVLDSNDWDNNRHGDAKPVSQSNRFGGAVGGPMLPNMLGGKTYFYFNYEGNRYPRSGPITRIVPSDMLRQGILQYRDEAGNVVQYNLQTSTQCGLTGGEACDPRGLGINPVVSQIWNNFMPEPNDFISTSVLGTSIDKLNNFAYRGNISYPLSDNFIVGRVDHDFGSKLRWWGSYRWFKENNPNTSQVDIGGVVAGDTKGQPASASSNVQQPRYFVTGLTATLSPNVTNEFHFDYMRNFWQWFRAGALPQVSGIPAAVEIGGQSQTAMIPMNVDTQNARSRLWNGHGFDYRDTLSWIHGNHFMQFGGEYFRQWLHFNRYDNVVGGLTQLGYEVNNTGVQMTSDYQPAPCGEGVTTNCLPSAQISNWNTLYAQALGLVSRASIVATRRGKDLTLNPLGTPLESYDIVNSYHLYFNDSWHIRPNLTLNYGVNWGVSMPPYDVNGTMMTGVDEAGNPITVAGYLANKKSFAEQGRVYSPLLGWSPLGAVQGGLKYPYEPYYGGIGPRISLAWSPSFSSGWLGSIFGSKSTVLRGGYARVYDRSLPIGFISNTVLGVGFLQSVSCTNPNTTGACAGTGQVNPNSAFRIGTDGNVVPLQIDQTLQTPVIPGYTAPYAIVAEFQDPKYRPAATDQIDFSIQRQLGGNMILEVGWLGAWSKHLSLGVDLGDVPYMLKLNGQTFAQAYQGLYYGLSSGKTPANLPVQPFFEGMMGGTPYCAGFASCTAAVATNESGNILNQAVTDMVSDLDYQSNLPGYLLPSTDQCFYCFPTVSTGYANYQALIVSLQKRTSHGLTLNGNFTYSHALGLFALNQTYTFANLTDVWNPRVDYGPQYYDRKFVGNILGTYELPFGKGKRFSSTNPVLSRLIGGWAFSPVFSFGTGMPLPVFDGSFEEGGQAFSGNGANAVPIVNTRYISNSAHEGITLAGASNPNSVGINGDKANGGSGVNIFGNNAVNVYNSFRPWILGVDGRSMTTGQLRGMPRWNLDLGLTKETQITERVGIQFFAQAFNALNHMQYADPYSGSPYLSLQDPYNFGVLDTEYAVLNNNYTRVIQLGLRVHF